MAQQYEQGLLHASVSKGAQEFFYKNSSLRVGGYIYVAGASLNNNGDYDMLVTKYQGSSEVWSKTWDGTSGGDDYAANVSVDGSGNVVIVGATYIGNDVNYDGVIVKYAANGSLLWSSTYSNPNNLTDGFVSSEVDASGNIYACGGTTDISEATNFLTVKYSSSGTLQWDSEYDFNNLEDVAVKLVLGGTSVRVSGGSQNTATDWKMTTVSYSTSTGAQTAVKQTGGDNDGIDQVTDAWTDGTYTYVTGSVSNVGSMDWKVIKLDDDLSVIWSDTYDGPDGLDDSANSLSVDSQGNVYVTGYSTTSAMGKDVLTRKYNSNGTLQWSVAYSNEGEDEAYSIELDANSNVLVTGSSYRTSNLDYVLVKYKGTNGALVWSSFYNADYNGDDIPSNIAIDDSGDIYVIGTVGLGDGSTTYMLCKYVVKTIKVPSPADGFPSASGYIRNLGQLLNSDGTENTSVEYYCRSHSPSTYVNNSRMSYLFSSLKDSILTDTLHRVDMKFNKGTGSATVYPILERSDYRNFYLGHLSSGVERLHVQDAIIKPGVYTNTDVIFANDASGFVHWIVAGQGAPTSDFELQFDGQTSLTVDASGNLVIETAVVDHEVGRPTAYTMNTTTGELSMLAWQPDFSIVGGNKVNFSNLGSWSGTLVLELKGVVAAGTSVTNTAELEWSTYFGGDASDFLQDVISNSNGSCAAIGSTRSASFPLIPDILVLNELSNPSNHDAFIASFNPDCSVDWFSYYGGSSSERGTAITRTDLNHFVGVGYTRSSDFPDVVDGPLDDSSLGGDQDGFIIRLNENGFSILDSFIGGAENDWITDVGFREVGSQKDLYLVGTTKSTQASLPLISPTGAYAQNYAGSTSGSFIGDGFIMRLNADNNNVIWRSFYGSDARDACLELAFSADDVFVVGTTSSDSYSQDDCNVPTDGDFPHCIPTGSWEETDFGPTGSTNHFIARFSGGNNGLLWSTILSATTSNEFDTGTNGRQAIGIGSSNSGSQELYVCGALTSAGLADFDFVTSPNSGAYNQTTQWSTSPFLRRFRIDNGLNDLTWSTLIDGDGYQTASAVDVSDDGKVYVVGFGKSEIMQDMPDWCSVPDITDDGFPICNLSGLNYMETNTVPTWWRSFITAFDPADGLLWSSRFGNWESNKIHSVSVQGNYVHICGAADALETANETWTLMDYNELSLSDYYQSVHGGASGDGCISRFERVLVTDLWHADVESEALQIYPVPSHEEVTFEIPINNFTNMIMTIYDSQGSVVKVVSFQGPRLTVAVKDFTPGVYMVSISGESMQYKGKFVKL